MGGNVVTAAEDVGILVVKLLVVDAVVADFDCTVRTVIFAVAVHVVLAFYVRISVVV